MEMKLEAGKEMDRRCVMDWLNEVYVTPSRAFSSYTDDELKIFAYDALVLLNADREGYVSVPFSWLVKFCTCIEFKEPMSDVEREKLWKQKLKQQFGIEVIK